LTLFMRHYPLFNFAIIGLLLLGQGTARAELSRVDGFVAAKRIETAYFTVSLAPGVDEAGLARKLDVRRPARPASGLGEVLDRFYEWAGRVLDMQVTGYHGHVKVARDARHLKDIYLRLYGAAATPAKGFYVPEQRTLYVSAPDFTREVLAHEIGHVVVSHYFVVQPSVKAAEVLAGYIEFQLRKLIAAGRHDDVKG
jgi:hypothetical protein